MKMQQEQVLIDSSFVEDKTLPMIPEIKILAGGFALGSKPLDAHTPLHLIEIKKDFYMMDTLVSQELWNEFCPDNPSNWIGNNLPVNRVSWVEAVFFANLLSKKFGHDPVYRISNGVISFDGTKNGFRLPFEIEWEYAAKADSSFEYSGSDEYGDVAAHIDLENKLMYTKAMPLKTKKPNDWGLYDMTGNLSEWCNDFFREDAYEQRIKKTRTQPHIFDVSEIQFNEDLMSCQNFSHKKIVIRGGSWFNTATHSKVHTRDFQNMMYQSSMVGIRLVRTIF